MFPALKTALKWALQWAFENGFEMQVLVFMDDLPMGQANKAQRVRLAERLSLTAVDDRAPQVPQP